jgi:probable HAF family extracellular repeat protein
VRTAGAWLAVAAAVASLAAADGRTRPQARSGWTVEAIIGLGGRSSQAFGVNDAGQVVGIAETVEGDQHAFVWSAGPGATDVGTLGGTASTAFGINLHGEVAGLAYVNAALQPHAFAWRGGKIADLGTLGGPSSSGIAVNAGGEIAGNSPPATGVPNHAFVARAGAPLRDLGTLGGTFSTVGGINAAGAVAGTSTLRGGTAFHAFVWTPARGMRDLGGTQQLPNTLAAGINVRGEVVGTGFPGRGNNSRGLVWSGGRITEVGVLSGDLRSELYAVNDVGEAVGISYAPSGAQHAMLASGGRLVPLTPLAPRGWTLTGAFAIDDLGEVAGTGTFGGRTTGFLLSPPPRTELAHLAALAHVLSVRGSALTLLTDATGSGRVKACSLLARFGGALGGVHSSATARLQLKTVTARVVDRLCGGAPHRA